MRRPSTAVSAATLCAAAVALVALPGVALGGTAVEREPLDVRLFARVGSPGQPEGIVVDTDGTVYVSTHNHDKGDADAPSKVFAYAPDGELLRDYEISSQHDDESHGLLQMAFDADGLLYVLGRNPAQVFTLDPDTGEEEVYATFADVPPCQSVAEGEPCSAAAADLGAFPDYPVFAPDGTMYVTDLEQALIWRVPPGGGEAEVWFTDARLESVFGPNGIQFLDDGETLLFAQTGSLPPGTTDGGTGKLYTLPVADDGSPGELELFWEGQPVDGPDGFAVAASGKVYVALAGANQVLLLSPGGEELARVPATPVDNQQQEVPFDTPASVAFHGERILVTNQSFFTGTEASWAVLDVFAGEEGLPLFRPEVAAAGDGDGSGSGGAPDDGASGALAATGGGAAGMAALAVLVAAGLRGGARWGRDRAGGRASG